MNIQVAEAYSIFEQPWWLDATAPGQWDAIEIEEGGRTVARLPFVYKKKYGLRIIGQPQLTPTLGPWVEQPPSSYSRRLVREKELFAKLTSRLPRFDSFHQNFHPTVTNWLPFYWDGFSQTTGYTYTINDLSDPNKILREMSKSSRYSIKRAEKTISVVSSDGIDEIVRLVEKTFQRQGKPMPYPADLLYRIDEAAKIHGYRRALLGVDQDGQIHSAAYVVGDQNRAYLLVSGADPALRQSGSGNIVHWSAIVAASKFTEVFDFEGSMIESIEGFYRGFGAIQTPYHAVSKNNRLFESAVSIRRLLRK